MGHQKVEVLPTHHQRSEDKTQKEFEQDRESQTLGHLSLTRQRRASYHDQNEIKTNDLECWLLTLDGIILHPTIKLRTMFLLQFTARLRRPTDRIPPQQHPSDLKSTQENRSRKENRKNQQGKIVLKPQKPKKKRKVRIRTL